MVDQDGVREARVGEGPIPERLDRLNPGAFMLAGLWSLVYGTWPWFFAFLAVMLVNIAISVFFRVPPGAAWPLVVGRQLASQLIVIGISIPYSLRANRLYWEKENRRIHTQSVPRPPATVAKFERDQRNWLLGGFVVLAYLVATPFLTSALRTPAYIAAQVVYAGVQLAALGTLYLWDRSRRGASGQS
jgi:hypothetical protein